MDDEAKPLNFTKIKKYVVGNGNVIKLGLAAIPITRQ